MSKHYRRRQARPSNTGLFRSVMLVCASFLSGYLAASYMDIGHLGLWLASLRPETSQLVPAPQMASHKPKPKLEFYTLLTTNHQPVGQQPPRPAQMASVVAVNKPVAPVVTAKPVAPMNMQIKPASVTLARQINHEVKSVATKSATPGQNYTIQVAAFRARQDAEHMKASLLLRGFPVNVSAVGANGATWFRVMVGPFASRAQAEETQSVLIRRERMNGMIRKMDA